MTDGRIRIRLAQALTRVDNQDAYSHIQAALTELDHFSATETTHLTDTHQFAKVETSLEHWLVLHATAGVPETVLIRILRKYADRIQTLGYIPRSWHPRYTQSATDRGPHHD